MCNDTFELPDGTIVRCDLVKCDGTNHSGRSPEYDNHRFQWTAEDKFSKAVSDEQNANNLDKMTLLMLAADHSYNCQCAYCYRYHTLVGPEEDGNYGVFGRRLYDSYVDWMRETNNEI